MEDKVAYCHMIAVTLAADGRVTDNERAFLDRAMARLGLTEEQRDQVMHFEGVVDAENLAKAWPAEKRRELLDEIVAAALADGKLSPLEMKTVERLSELLGFGEASS